MDFLLTIRLRNFTSIPMSLSIYHEGILNFIKCFSYVSWDHVAVVLYSIGVAAAARSLQSCPTLCDPIDCSPPGSPVPRILQSRTLEWVAISFSNAWKWKVKVKSLSHARLFKTPWTVACQAPPFMGFSRQEYWSGLPLPSPLLMWSITWMIFKY